MKMTIAVIIVCLLLTSIASSIEETKETGDWLSGGYVVAHHYPGPSWRHGISYSVYHDSAVFDPWYRNVAWPFLNDWYWPPSYYRSGIRVYPVHYYYPAPYWYDPDWSSPIYS